jgi:glucosamine--fructose-6-phosphate aminotransferase (isomerizing)
MLEREIGRRMSEQMNHVKSEPVQDGRVFPHAMLREIYEQPEALQATLAHYVEGHAFRASGFSGELNALLDGRSTLVIAASGSSRHAGLAGEIILEDFADLSVDVEYSSEYCYRSKYTLHEPAVLVISQSGETADTLGALREAKSTKLPVMAMANVAGSSMAREASVFLPTMAGVEKAIPATKSFTTQLAVLYLLGLHLARHRKTMPEAAIEARLDDVARLPGLIARALPEWERATKAIAETYRHATSLLLLGRGIHYAIAREGALKVKESSYMQAEGYPTGELKHGPNALVTTESPLIVLATCDRADKDSVTRYGKTLQLMRDMRAQGAEILALASEGDAEVEAVAHHTVFVPAVNEHLAPICEVIPLQLLAYALAIGRGIDVDNPRNLVKAVVQE